MLLQSLPSLLPARTFRSTKNYVGAPDYETLNRARPKFQTVARKTQRGPLLPPRLTPAQVTAWLL